MLASKLPDYGLHVKERESQLPKCKESNQTQVGHYNVKSSIFGISLKIKSYQTAENVTWLKWLIRM